MLFALPPRVATEWQRHQATRSPYNCRHAPRCDRNPGPQVRQLRPHLADARRRWRVRAPRPSPRAVVAAAAGVVAGAARGAGAAEIGRASWRDGGCRYVWISGGGVLLNTT